jgi:DNA-binding CsgD family transcriptional regulator
MGLVSRAGDKPMGFVAPSPELALEALFVQRRLELEKAQGLGLQLIEEAKTQAGKTRTTPKLVTVVEGWKAAAKQAYQLQQSVNEEMLVLEKSDFAEPPGPNPDEVTMLERGVRCRVVYEGAVLEIEGVIDRLQEWASAGEEARVTGTLPLRMLIGDRRAAWIPMHDEEGLITGAAIVHSAELLVAFVALFERVWERAVPLLGTLDPGDLENADMQLSEMENLILTLMVSGLKDEAIALRIGVNKSTVRRHIKRLMDELGASTRFQAGLQVSRRGLI